MKKTIVIAIAFGLLLLFLAGDYSHAADGDLNGDGVVNILDLVIIASHFGERIDATQMPSPDVNGDGTVNILDLVYVANLIGSSDLLRLQVSSLGVEVTHSRSTRHWCLTGNRQKFVICSMIRLSSIGMIQPIFRPV